LSGPRQTTTQTIAPADDAGPGGLDFARAAAVLTDAAAKAGAAIMAHFGDGSEFTLKDDNSPVTRADRDSEAIILAALARLAPDIRVVSEESCGTIGALPRRFFLVDPLDGTKEFIQKRSDFTINVALIEDGRPSFGLVCAPARALLAVTVAAGKAVSAELPPSKSGADLGQLRQTALRARPPGKRGLTALVSLSHLDPATEAYLATLNIAERSSVGSSVKFVALAKGDADIYPRFGPTMEWDTAAGQAVLEAAGGRVVTSGGEPLHYGKTEAGLRNPSFIAWGLRA
jgi:3'(2'), 5'-bisphosphate nucleotidase